MSTALYSPSFALAWPLGRRLRWLSQAHSLVNGETSSSHILVIDEEPEILALIRELLEGEGFRVSTCRRTAPDLHEIKSLAPSLIVLDAPWPEQDGVAAWPLLQQLRFDQETRAIPIVLCTGNRRALLAGDDLAALGVTTIAKPFDIAGFVAVVSEALRSCDKGFTTARSRELTWHGLSDEAK